MLPPIKFDFVAGGIGNVLSALKTVEQSVAQHEQRITKMRNQSAEAYLNIQKKIESEAKAHSERMVSIAKGEQEKIKSLVSNTRNRELEEERNHTSRMASEVKRRGHLLSSVMKGLGINNIPGASNVAGQLGSTGEGIGWVGAGVIGAASLTAVAIKKGVDILIGAFSSAAHDYASAILEIGGGFSVSGSLVSAAKLQRKAAGIASSVYDPAERMTRKEIEEVIRSTSSGTEFRPEEVADAFRTFTEKTGKPKDFARLAPFITQVATATGTDLNQTATTFGRMQTQFRTLDESQLKDLTLRMIALGAKGTVEFKDMSSVGKITGAATMMQGNLTENIAKQVGLAQIVEPLAGSLDEATTMVSAFNREVVNLAAKKPAVAKQFGIEFKEGKVSDLNKVIENAVVTFIKSPAKLPAQFREARANSFIRAIGAQLEPGMNETQQREAIQKLLKEFQTATITMENLDQAHAEVAGTIDYQLKAAFNDLTTTVGENLLPHLKDFAEQLPDLIPTISEGITDFYNLVAEMIPALYPIFRLFGDSLLLLTQVIGTIIPDAYGGDKMVKQATAARQQLATLGMLMDMSPEERKDYSLRKKAMNMSPEDREKRINQIQSDLMQYSLPGTGEFNLDPNKEMNKRDKAKLQELGALEVEQKYADQLVKAADTHGKSTNMFAAAVDRFNEAVGNIGAGNDGGGSGASADGNTNGTPIE